MVEHRLSIWDDCTHDVEISDMYGHITCADCGHVRIAEIELARLCRHCGQGTTTDLSGFYVHADGVYHCDPDNTKGSVADPRPVITDVPRVQLVNTHPESSCAGQSACPLHNPTDHHMRGWEVVWRDDTGVLERLCPHGIGHPDPDQFPYWDANGMEARAVHGCDLCCKPGHAIKMPDQRAI